MAASSDSVVDVAEASVATSSVRESRDALPASPVHLELPVFRC